MKPTEQELKEALEWATHAINNGKYADADEFCVFTTIEETLKRALALPDAEIKEITSSIAGKILSDTAKKAGWCANEKVTLSKRRASRAEKLAEALIYNLKTMPGTSIEFFRQGIIEVIAKMEAEVRAETIEECAKICDEAAKLNRWDDIDQVEKWCAEKIRNLSRNGE